MARTGRKPRAEAAVEQLHGSPRAKERLAMFIRTMRGELTVPDACGQLGIGPSRFHAMRSRWLQQSLELLEPRRVGRPPGRAPQAQLAEPEQLQRQVHELQGQLAASQVRQEIAAVMPHIIRPEAPSKRGSRRGRRRRAR